MYANVMKIKKVPIVTIMLLFWATVISTITVIAPTTYTIIYEKKEITKVIIWLTNMLLHGANGTFLSMMNHLIGNAIIAVSLGFAFEKMFGSLKTFIIVFLSMAGCFIYEYLKGNYGHGASKVIFSFAMLAFIFIYYEIKNGGWTLFKKPSNYLLMFIALYASQQIIFPLASGRNFGGGVAHLISLLVGVVFYVVHFKAFKEFEASDGSSEKIICKRLAIVVLIAISICLTAFIAGVPKELKNRQALKTKLMENQHSIDRETVNRNNGEFILQFEDDMRQVYVSTAVHRITRGLSQQLVVQHKWLDSKTLHFKINLPLDSRTESLSIELQNLKNARGELIYDSYPIQL